MLYPNHLLIELLLKTLQKYRLRYPEEDEIICKFEQLLVQPLCFLKDGRPAHFTGSAWIIDPHRSKVLLLEHPKLHKWLQPGGHLEEGEFPWQAAYREVQEEVGLRIDFIEKEEDVVIPLDLDCHLIPARGSQSEHWHYDFRFLVYVKEESEIGGDEGLTLKWFDLGEMHHPIYEASIERMASKTALLRQKQPLVF